MRKSMLRRILRIKYTDRVSNAEVRVRTGQEIAENTVRKRRMKWYGHISRMNKERWPSIVHNWKPTGKRPVGRPKQRWMDNIEKDLKRASLSLYGITTGRNRVRLEELFGDRERFKNITAASMAGRAFRMAIPDLTCRPAPAIHKNHQVSRKTGVAIATLD